jgi:hypothetical protein
MFKESPSKVQKNESKPEKVTRSIARKLARPLSADELDAISAGTGTCSCGCDDCDLSQR